MIIKDIAFILIVSAVLGSKFITFGSLNSEPKVNTDDNKVHAYLEESSTETPDKWGRYCNISLNLVVQEEGVEKALCYIPLRAVKERASGNYFTKLVEKAQKELNDEVFYPLNHRAIITLFLSLDGSNDFIKLESKTFSFSNGFPQQAINQNLHGVKSLDPELTAEQLRELKTVFPYHPEYKTEETWKEAAGNFLNLLETNHDVLQTPSQMETVIDSVTFNLMSGVLVFNVNQQDTRIVTREQSSDEIVHVIIKAHYWPRNRVLI